MSVVCGLWFTFTSRKAFFISTLGLGQVPIEVQGLLVGFLNCSMFVNNENCYLSSLFKTELDETSISYKSVVAHCCEEAFVSGKLFYFLFSIKVVLSFFMVGQNMIIQV